MKRTATARWQGGLKNGKGVISTESKTLTEAPYSFVSRFEQGTGTNPEELVAAAHAGCYSMALSLQLDSAGMTAESIETTCVVTFQKEAAGWTVVESHLDVTARIPRADRAKFEEAASNAKSNCPISKLLNAKITMDAKLVATA